MAGSRSRTWLRALSVAASSALVVSLVVAAPGAAAQPQVDRPTDVELTATIRDFLVERAVHITGQPAATPRGLARGRSFAATARSRFATLDKRRDIIGRVNVEYAAADIDVTLERVDQVGTTLTVAAREHTALRFRNPKAGDPEATEYAEDHVITFVLEAGSWIMADQRPARLDTMPPVTEAVEAVGLAPADDPAVAGAPPDGYAEPVAASTVKPQGKLTLDARAISDLQNGAVVTPMAIPAGLNYTAMTTYAKTYWNNYNPAYKSFSGAGGDCTNFISQILREGGWTFVTGIYTSGDAWWYNAVNQSYTWADAENWSWFAPKRTVALSRVYDMTVADVLQYDLDKNGTMDHTMFVQKKTTTDIYMTYHSSNHYNRPLAEILALYPAAAWYAYRT